MNKAIYIDRDGVVNSDEGHYYVYKTEDFVFNTDIEEALALLKKHGFLLILITNQGGVAKGEYSEDDVKSVHQHMQKHLKQHQADFDAIYYCPHHDAVSTCHCRKPKPGMILQARKDHDIDIKKSFLIGDSQRDIDAGIAAGIETCYKVPKNTSILSIAQQIINKKQ
ncbi:D-glycero-alpha-D-manno-heptose-1,7-bisphosphate 7-phosphatase [Plebeiibacterium marinum]|uniref:D,D-heptose 1,7-bisphosphate phosphatase n=1 Tax=Plebeiibacterium marinum TaxID=2992111 RepID=A0AAE3MDH7_9BACT|nr:HAD family hydrolase [Plebeiobacterium marinum]MCW3805022.1 HAD family hydrolase [Plebeiobacterium marinum]